MSGLPVIRFEVEHMKHAMLVALAEHQLKMDEHVRQAVENFCKPENISRILQQQLGQALEEAIRSEVEAFFLYGKGRNAVKAAVLAKLGDEL